MYMFFKIFLNRSISFMKIPLENLSFSTSKLHFNRAHFHLGFAGFRLRRGFMTRHPRFNPLPEFTPDQSVQALKRKCVNLYRV